jgi:hypothetical protein
VKAQGGLYSHLVDAVPFEPARVARHPVHFEPLGRGCVSGFLLLGALGLLALIHRIIVIFVVRPAASASAAASSRRSSASAAT